MAAVIAKNTVGSSWRKTLGSREWSRVQEDEKASVRRRALDCLLQDRSERVAIQVDSLHTGETRSSLRMGLHELLKLVSRQCFSFKALHRAAAGISQDQLAALKTDWILLVLTHVQSLQHDLL